VGMVASLCAVNEDDVFHSPYDMNPKRLRAPKIKMELDDFFEFVYESEGASDTDKAWDMLHICLNGGARMPFRKTIAAMSIMGEIELAADGAAVNYVSSKTVPSVAMALAEFSEAEIDRIVPTFDADDVYSVTGDDDEGYVRQALRAVRSVFNLAKERGQAVVIVIG